MKMCDFYQYKTDDTKAERLIQEFVDFYHSGKTNEILKEVQRNENLSLPRLVFNFSKRIFSSPNKMIQTINKYPAL